MNPGRRSQTRFALGYHLSGFQPFESVRLGGVINVVTVGAGITWRLGTAQGTSEEVRVRSGKVGRCRQKAIE